MVPIKSINIYLEV